MSSTEAPCIRSIEYGNLKFSLLFHSEMDHIGLQIAQSGRFYEAELLDALRLLVDPGAVIVDVGANVGNHSTFFAGVMNCSVFAVEAVERTCDLLRENIKLNGLSQRVFPRQFALGSKVGTLGIESFDELNLGATRLGPGSDDVVNVRTLDSMQDLAEAAVALIKIDVEGMELDVLRGAKGVIIRDEPVIVCECAEDGDFLNVNSFLVDLGYTATECFNATPTYLFLPHSWTGSSQMSRLSYFEGALARTSFQVRSSAAQISHTRNMVGRLAKRLDLLEASEV